MNLFYSNERNLLLCGTLTSSTTWQYMQYTLIMLLIRNILRTVSAWNCHRNFTKWHFNGHTLSPAFTFEFSMIDKRINLQWEFLLQKRNGTNKHCHNLDRWLCCNNYTINQRKCFIVTSVEINMRQMLPVVIQKCTLPSDKKQWWMEILIPQILQYVIVKVVKPGKT